MKKNLKWLLCLLSTIAIMFAGCASGGSDSESAECEVGKIYAEKHFSEEEKNDVKKMVSDIISVYRKRLENNTWMSDATKAKAISSDKIELFVYGV